MPHEGTQKVSDKEELKRLHKLVRIPVEFHKQQTHALLDTGAAASFISAEKFATLNNNIITNENVATQLNSFVSATGKIMYPLGHYSIALKLSPECKLQHSFFVLPDLRENCILGIDFFKKHEIKLDIANKKLSLTVNGKKLVILLKKIVFPIYHVNSNDSLSFELSHLQGAEKQALNNVLKKTYINICFKANRAWVYKSSETQNSDDRNAETTRGVQNSSCVTTHRSSASRRNAEVSNNTRKP